MSSQDPLGAALGIRSSQEGSPYFLQCPSVCPMQHSANPSGTITGECASQTWGPWACCVSTTGEHVRNAGSWAPSSPTVTPLHPPGTGSEIQGLSRPCAGAFPGGLGQLSRHQVGPPVWRHQIPRLVARVGVTMGRPSVPQYCSTSKGPG